MSTYAGFRAKENADAVSAGILGGSMTDAAADAAYYAALGSLSASLLSSSGGSAAAQSIFDTVIGWFTKK